MEKFGYRGLVRPLGVMPDIVLWCNRNDGLRLVLAEAKASTKQTLKQLIVKNVSQFLIDIKTRAQGFSYHELSLLGLFGSHPVLRPRKGSMRFSPCGSWLLFEVRRKCQLRLKIPHSTC